MSEKLDIGQTVWCYGINGVVKGEIVGKYDEHFIIQAGLFRLARKESELFATKEAVLRAEEI